ncbi:verprolin-like [Glycine soja]|uniref:verprolin-like n=1 Tax=Glycine soja TaxID=3848 RepID=UPI00103EAB27|nr:verprolin-like [Glycine soja]
MDVILAPATATHTTRRITPSHAILSTQLSTSNHFCSTYPLCFRTPLILLYIQFNSLGLILRAPTKCLLCLFDIEGTPPSFQHPPRMTDAEPSPAGVDRLEAAMAKFVVAQLRLESTLDTLLLKLPSRISHQYQSSSSVQSPPSPPPSRPTTPSCLVPMQHNQSPLPTPPPIPPPSSMSNPPSLHALIQPHPTPLSAPLFIVVVPLLANSNPHASFNRR